MTETAKMPRKVESQKRGSLMPRCGARMFTERRQEEQTD
jgi:hypothetical protein